jgi:hypothetical protein
MTLPAFTSLEELPEALRPFAREADGTVTLDLVPGSEAATLRRHAADLLAEKKALAARFADVDPDEYKALKSRKAPTDDAVAKLDAAARENADLKARLAAIETARRADLKRSEIVRAISDAGGVVDLLEHKLDKMVDVEDVDGRTRLVVRDESGVIKYRDSNTPYGVADVVAELRANPLYAPAFQVKVGSGGGAQQSAGAGGVRTISASDSVAFADNLADIARGKIRVA